MPSLALSRYDRFFVVASALILAVVASLALFLTIQSFEPYIALLKGQFYPPAVNSAHTVFDNAFSRSGLLLLRFALWPSVVFVALQAGASYAISRLLPFQGRFVATRRLAAGVGLSVLTSVLVLAAMWPVLVRMISR